MTGGSVSRSAPTLRRPARPLESTWLVDYSLAGKEVL